MSLFGVGISRSHSSITVSEKIIFIESKYVDFGRKCFRTCELVEVGQTVRIVEVMDGKSTGRWCVAKIIDLIEERKETRGSHSFTSQWVGKCTFSIKEQPVVEVFDECN